MVFGQRRPWVSFALSSHEALGRSLQLPGGSSRSGGSGMLREQQSRSASLVGDVNGDGLQDFLIGRPAAASCALFFGQAGQEGDVTSLEAVEDVSFHGQLGSGLGWAATRLSDVNGDGLTDFVVSAPQANAVQLLHGRAAFPRDVFLPQGLGPGDGLSLTATGGAESDQLQLLGLAVANGRDVNGDGHHGDLVLSAVRPSDGRNVVLVLFSGPLLWSRGPTILLDTLPGGLCLLVVGPARSFVGFSLAGLGDFDRDGRDDLALGGLPYAGGYQEQRTFVVLGRATGGLLDLSAEGAAGVFWVGGAGFMVAGPGDVDGDGAADLLVTAFADWPGQGNAYTLLLPANLSAPPAPSPTSQPSSAALASDSPASFPLPPSLSRAPTTSVPSPAPSWWSALPTPAPSRLSFLLSTDRPSLRPSKPRRPSARPSTHRPTEPAYNGPCLRTRRYSPGDYDGRELAAWCDQRYLVQGSGRFSFRLLPGRRNIFVLFPPAQRTRVRLEGFQPALDQLDLGHLRPAVTSMADLSAFPGPPPSLLFAGNVSARAELVVELPGLVLTDLAARNFVFGPAAPEPAGDGGTAVWQQRILMPALVALLLAGVAASLLTVARLQGQGQEHKKDSSAVLFTADEEAPPALTLLPPITLLNPALSASTLPAISEAEDSRDNPTEEEEGDADGDESGGSWEEISLSSASSRNSFDSQPSTPFSSSSSSSSSSSNRA